jgi:hypothetical protein
LTSSKEKSTRRGTVSASLSRKHTVGVPRQGTKTGKWSQNPAASAPWRLCVKSLLPGDSLAGRIWFDHEIRTIRKEHRRTAGGRWKPPLRGCHTPLGLLPGRQANPLSSPVFVCSVCFVVNPIASLRIGAASFGVPHLCGPRLSHVQPPEGGTPDGGGVRTRPD